MDNGLTIQEGNKLIAESLGYYFSAGKFYSKDGRGKWFKEPRYDRSWDWMMPAWQNAYRSLRLLNDSTAHKIFDQMRGALLNADLPVANEILIHAIKHLNTNQNK